MSYMFTSSSFPKVRQEGFHTSSSIQSPSGAQSQQSQHQQHIPTPNAFDPNAIYTTGALFADAYRATSADPFARRYEQQPQPQQAASSHSLDIHDELSFLNPPTSATSETFQQQQQQRPHDLFGVNQSHYPSLSLPHSRALYSRDDFSSTTPASLHNSYGRSDFFPSQSNPANTQSNDGRHPPELTPQQQQQQQQFGLMATAAANTLDQFNPGGEQSPASGVTRSRSRSRSKVSSNRNRVSKRPSLPPPPAEEQSPDSSRAPSATRPSAIVIPGSTHAQQSSHSFSSYHAGTHPASPATWGFATHTGDQYGAEASPAHQLFGTSFGGSGSLGPGQSPTTLNGSPPANPSEAAMKLALANEKRRKRRESHNAVERRRRDNINEKIQELAMLLPEEWLEGTKGQGPSIAGLLSGTVSGSALGSGGSNLDDDSKEIKANKGVILRNSVEYIKNLVQLVQVQRTRNQQLESELAQYRNRYGSVNSTSGAGAGSITLNGSGVSPGMQSTGQTDDEANAMAGYVLSDALSSPEPFDVKNLFPQSSIGPLDVISHASSQSAHGHGHTMSSSGMEGVETSNPVVANTRPAGNGGLTSGVAGMLIDTTSPSTGSGENEEVDDEEMHRGRRTTRFPPGVGKQEDEITTL